MSNFSSNVACARFPLAAVDTRKKIANRRADLRTRTNSSFHQTSLPQIVSVVRPICGDGGRGEIKRKKEEETKQNKKTSTPKNHPTAHPADSQLKRELKRRARVSNCVPGGAEGGA